MREQCSLLTVFLQHPQTHLSLPPPLAWLRGEEEVTAGTCTELTSKPGARGFAQDGSVILRALDSSKSAARAAESVQV